MPEVEREEEAAELSVLCRTPVQVRAAVERGVATV
jgi:hypothetical protein